ncbi:MAG: potassium channel family protein [Acidimicrobiia bacterium]
MGGRRRFRAGLITLAVVGVGGTAWFWLVEGYSVVEAAFQTTTTITTVGFGEVHPFDTSARVFAIVLMLVGVAAALFTFGGALEELVEGSVNRFGRRRMERRIDSISHHLVLCGYGRVGEAITTSIGAEHDIVVVDQDPQRCLLAVERGFAAVSGDATEDDVLAAAGVARAAVVVVSLHSDGDAISSVLSARALAPAVRVVARANSANSEPKLARAGADHVVNPLRLGAEHLAGFATRPSVAGFMEVVAAGSEVEMRLEEVALRPGSRLAGQTLAAANVRELTGALVLALRDGTGAFVSNPEPSRRLEPGTILIAIGTDAQLAALARHGTETPDAVV